VKFIMRAPLFAGVTLSILMLAACGGGGNSAPAAQTISFSPPSTALTVNGTAQLSATATSSLTVSYASNSTSICTVSGTTVTGVSAGTCSVTANQSGNSGYSPATPVTVTFTINGDPQTITFNSPTAPSVNGTSSLSASASSGLAVSFASNTPSVCTVSGTTLTGVSAGSCTVTASQSGNGTYAAAASVSHTFSVAAAQAIFSAGFPASGSVTASGGSFGSYQGTSDTNAAAGCNNGQWCGSGLGANTTPATNNYYLYLQSTTFNTLVTSSGYSYMGIYVQAPGVTSLSTTGNTSGVTLNGQSKMSFTFNNNPEWAATTNTNILVRLTLGNYYNVGTVASPVACNVVLQTVMTPTGGTTPTAYTIPLSGFVVAQNCGNSALTPSSVTAALSGNPISQVDFQSDGGGAALTVNGLTTGFNTSVANSAGYYPTTLSVTGAITFQ
jgi:hypothetical protein